MTLLKNIELQFQLPVIVVLFRLLKLDQLLDIVFCQEGAAQNSHNFIDAPVKFDFLKEFDKSNNSEITNLIKSTNENNNPVIVLITLKK